MKKEMPGNHTGKTKSQLTVKIDFQVDKSFVNTQVDTHHCLNCGRVVKAPGGFCSDRCADQWASYQEDVSIDELHDWQEMG